MGLNILSILIQPKILRRHNHVASPIFGIEEIDNGCRRAAREPLDRHRVERQPRQPDRTAGTLSHWR